MTLAAPPHETPATSAMTATAAMQVVVLRDAAELAWHEAAWDELANSACEANVFYESWMLQPAIQAFGAGRVLEYYLVFEARRGPDSMQPQLCGFFPMERSARFKGLPVEALALWKHLYCMLCTPLVRKGREVETLDALLRHFAQSPDAPAVLRWNTIAAEGAFAQAMVDVFGQRRTAMFVDESWTRALMRPATSGDDYVKNALSGKRRKEFKRQENRLGEVGHLQYALLEPDWTEDESFPLETWIEEFLRLEAGGWKGEAGSAFACDPVHREFFRTICLAAHQRRRLMMMALQVDGRAVAAKCDFLSGPGAFAFKIAFDEEFARFSPGVLLEIESIHRLHDHTEVRWMDSCAVQDHFMINRLWTERRTLQNLVIATGRRRTAFIVSVLPLLRWIKDKSRRSSPKMLAKWLGLFGG